MLAIYIHINIYIYTHKCVVAHFTRSLNPVKAPWLSLKHGKLHWTSDALGKRVGLPSMACQSLILYFNTLPHSLPLLVLLYFFSCCTLRSFKGMRRGQCLRCGIRKKSCSKCRLTAGSRNRNVDIAPDTSLIRSDENEATHPDLLS